MQHPDPASRRSGPTRKNRLPEDRQAMRLARKTATLLTGAIDIMCTGHTRLGAERLPDVEIRLHNGRPNVFIDGAPNALTTYSNFGQQSGDVL